MKFFHFRFLPIFLTILLFLLPLMLAVPSFASEPEYFYSVFHQGESVQLPLLYIDGVELTETGKVAVLKFFLSWSIDVYDIDVVSAVVDAPSYSDIADLTLSFSDVWTGVSYSLKDGLWVKTNLTNYNNNELKSYSSLKENPIYFSGISSSVISGKSNISGSPFDYLKSTSVQKVLPPPPTVADIMSGVGKIFSSAVSWVSDVGAAIISQPLLLAFTALPLCGLGIAVYRRFKGTA